MAVVSGRLTDALQDLEVKVTQIHERANGMPQGESWTVGLEDSGKLDRKEFLAEHEQ